MYNPVRVHWEGKYVKFLELTWGNANEHRFFCPPRDRLQMIATVFDSPTSVDMGGICCRKSLMRDCERGIRIINLRGNVLFCKGTRDLFKTAV
jgi:hypothetical protein